MKDRRSQNEKMTIEFIPTNGVGSVMTTEGLKDVYVYGMFKMWHWHFIVHQDVSDPEFFTVSEASTGMSLKDEVYYTIEDALYYIVPFIESKRYYFATAVGSKLTRTQCNLLRRNIGLTLTIDSVLW